MLWADCRAGPPVDLPYTPVILDATEQGGSLWQEHSSGSSASTTASGQAQFFAERHRQAARSLALSPSLVLSASSSRRSASSDGRPSSSWPSVPSSVSRRCCLFRLPTLSTSGRMGRPASALPIDVDLHHCAHRLPEGPQAVSESVQLLCPAIQTRLPLGRLPVLI